MSQKQRKTNPRRVPVSAADMNRAYRDGCILTMDVMLFTLATDMEVSDAWLDKFHERYMAHLRAYKAGYITQDDLRNALKDETGWEFELI